MATGPTRYGERGVTIEQMLSDNGSAHSPRLVQRLPELDITPKRTRPYRPHTDGKIEPFHRTLADGRAHARQHDFRSRGRAPLPRWVHSYNHHRAHPAVGGQPPTTRLTNLPGHHS